MSSEVQLTEATVGVTVQGDSGMAGETGSVLTSSDKPTEDASNIAAVSDVQMLKEVVADSTTASEEKPTADDGDVENSSVCKTDEDGKLSTAVKADADVSAQCSTVVTTKSRGGRSYQESRRSKKTAGEKLHSVSESSKCERTRELVNTHDFDAKCLEQKGKGDVRDAGMQQEDSVRHVKDSYHPTCDGDQPALVNVIIDEHDMRKSGEQLLNLIKHAPSSDKKHHGRDDRGRSVPSAVSRDLRGKAKPAAELEAQWKKEVDAKKAQEDEARRLEDEKHRQEEEKAEQERLEKEKELAEAQQLREEELKSLQDFINETRDRIESKSALREQNLNATENRPDESFFVKLDSTLKRNTAFVKKLRNLTETQKDAIIKDFNSLNLTMYVGEMADAVVEAKLKMSDINCALVLCSLIHQRYADFSALLLESWQKVLLTKKDEKVPNASKLRVDLRLFADLIAIGVFTEKEGLSMLANQLTLLMTNDREEHNNLSIVLCFCRHCGDDYAGLVPRKFRLLAEKHDMEIPRSQLLRVDRQKACRNLLKDYYTSLCKHLLNDCKELRGVEKQNRRILQTKGELSAERKDRYETMQHNFQKLLQMTQTLADLLDEDVPNLPEEESKVDLDNLGFDSVTVLRGATESQQEGDLSLYDDEETRQFYENVPDLKAIIPGILYKDSEHVDSAVAEPDASTTTDDGELDEDDMALMAEANGGVDASGGVETSGGVEVSGSVETSGGVEVTGADAKNKAESVKKDSKSEEEPLPDYDAVVAADVEEDDSDVTSSMKVLLETFLGNLPKCVSRELIDKAAVEFCMNLNTTVNRRKLVRSLFFVHRTRYDLLPFYARFVASLYPCMPSIANDLAVMLKGDFRHHVRKKDQINIESKLKTVRFIGELVKFNMFAKSEALHCIKMLLFDFTHHNIEMACSLLETCGRYLYRTAESHQRVKVYLEVMMRKKSALHLDSRYTTMIENAYYYSNPPEARQEAKVKRPPMHEYIRKLLYKDLAKTTIERVLRQMRKLDWDSIEIKEYAIKCLTEIWNLRYSNIHCCASLLAGLAPYEEVVGIQVIDGVLEDISLGLEVNHPKYNQQRVSSVRYLGELYNYRMVESHVIFRTLYSFITFGVSLDDVNPSLLDPPEHLFRIRLVCVLLETCGQYFDRGSSKKKLDCFLVYFQRYFWFKKKNPVWTAEHPFPRDVEYLMFDTLELLRPKLQMCTSWDEASQAADALDKEFTSKLAELVKPATDAATTDVASLPVIHESDEHDGGAGLTQLTSETMDDSDQDQPHSGSQSLSLKGDDGGFDDDGNAGHGYDDDNMDHEYLDSAGEEEMMDSGGEREDDKAARTVGLKHVKCTEDDDFMAAFDKMMSETLQARSQEVTKIPVVDIAVPLNVRAQTKSKPPVLNILSNQAGSSEQQQQQQVEGPIEDDATATGDNIAFTLLSKKGNKQQFATVSIPVSETFAAKFMEQIEVEKMEKERMKRVVLNIHERQEEEDYQEMMSQLNRQLPSNINRERRTPYQHPKGAPDADVIFGSKKR